MYVLVLGLDVLGNPFGFIRDLSEGVEAFFYEPYQVCLLSIQGLAMFVNVGYRKVVFTLYKILQKCGMIASFEILQSQ